MMYVDAPPPGFLKLRVGGREFEASREVLLSEPDSVFTAVLSDAWASGATQQLVFDRDPDRFRVVLNWLRTRELVCEGGVSAEGVRAEADFFQLHSLGQEASRLVEERDGHQLLRCALDSRRGTLVSLTPGDAASLPTGEPVLVHGPCVISVQAYFGTVGENIIGEVVDVATGEDTMEVTQPSFVVHWSDGRRRLSALGRVGAGQHFLQLLFKHEGMADTQTRSYVLGPARVEFWRYPADQVVWMDEEAALQNQAAWFSFVHGPTSIPHTDDSCPIGGVCEVVDENGKSGGSAALAHLVGALGSCVYR